MAASKIQARVRGRAARRGAEHAAYDEAEELDDNDDPQQAAAAVRIQARVRGRATRSRGAHGGMDAESYAEEDAVEVDAVLAGTGDAFGSFDDN